MEEPTTMRTIPGPGTPDAGKALVGFSIATAVRDAAISMGIVLGLLYLFPVVRRAASRPGWHRPVQQVRYWPLQGSEGDTLLALAVLLIAATIWLVHRRAA
jgi:hypothetical protein